MADQIGLHSARNGAAMAMFLAGVSVFQIMWASDAFLHYISQKWITKESFSTIPSWVTDQTKQQSIQCETATQNNIGSTFSSSIIPLVNAFC
jgi:hypothetical protein